MGLVAKKIISQKHIIAGKELRKKIVGLVPEEY